MNADEFRTFMMEHVRGFHNWSWRDAIQNPDDWKPDMTASEWLAMFFDYVSGDI